MNDYLLGKIINKVN